MTRNEINVLIADDSGFMQLLIKSILKSDNNIKVIGTATNGKEAYELTMYRRPDVVVMDINMPEYDGVYGVRRIMDECPTPVLILSTVENTKFGLISDALRLGAFDYLNKPQGKSPNLRQIDTDIVSKVQEASRVDPRKLRFAPLISNQFDHTFTSSRQYDIVLIGASTGGPSALERILKKMPKNMPVPVVIGQHMPSCFLASFAERLDRMVHQKVVVAMPGMVIESGHCYLAPATMNTRLRRTMSGRVKFEEEVQKFKEYNNPSIDSIFRSAASIYEDRAIAVLLTGMGQDGAEGLGTIQSNGGYTIAQDKQTSVVFGMPRAAIESGYANRVVPIDEIGEFIVTCLS